MNHDYQGNPEAVSGYADMMKDFLPQLFHLEGMADLCFRHLHESNLNAEQAATTLNLVVRQNLSRLLAAEELTDEKLASLMNAIAVLIHMRRMTVQVVATKREHMTPELEAGIQAILQERLSPQETQQRVRDLKKEHGLP